MAVIKIPNAGDTQTLHITKCEVVESQNIKNPDGTPQEQVKFTVPNGDTLFIGRDAADRALARIGFADGEQVLYGDVDGWTLRVYRVANKNPAYKPYWNIDKVTDGSHGTNVPNPRQREESAPKAKAPAMVDSTTQVGMAGKLAAIDAAYAHAYTVSQRVQGDETSTPESLQAGAATLLIAYQKDCLISHFWPKEPEAPKAPAAKATASHKAPPPSAEDEPDFAADDELPF